MFCFFRPRRFYAHRFLSLREISAFHLLIAAVFIDHIMTELYGQADTEKEAGPVLNLKMKMGFGRMPRVPAKSDSLAFFNPAAKPDFESFVLEMSQVAVFAVVMLNDHIVACRIPGFPIYVSELWIVRNPIIYPDDRSAGGRINGLAKTVVIFELFPVSRMSQPLVIFYKEIISIALIEDMPGVRILPFDASAFDMPQSFERKDEFRSLAIGSGFGQAASGQDKSGPLADGINNHEEEQPNVFSVRRCEKHA